MNTTDLDHISPSSLNEYLRCPKQFYFDYFTDYQGIEVDTTALNFGSAIHETAEYYFSILSQKPQSKSEVEKKIKTAFDETYKPIYKKKKKDMKRCKEHFIKFEKRRYDEWDEYMPTFVEKHIRIKGIPAFTGIIDFYGDNKIIDWKSGSPYFSTGKTRQGKFYELLLKRMGYEVDEVMFVFLKAGVIKKLPRTSTSWLKEEVRKMIDGISENIFPRKENKLCKYCKFQLRCELHDECLWDDIL